MNVRDLLIYCKESRVVRVAIFYLPSAWAVLRVVLIAQSGLDAPTWIPKLLAILLVVGYPVALIISWALDVGDHEKDQDRNKESDLALPSNFERRSSPKTSPVLFGSVLVGGTAVLAAMLYLMVGIPAVADDPVVDSEDSASSVAVLPFLNLTTDAEQQVFCDGLSEELLNLLTRVESLQVAARTSSFSVRDSDLDIPQIGKQLNVSHIVEGSVRRDGSQIRVTAQLVRAKDGYHVWSENYDREFTKIFEIQDDIAANIVTRLVKSIGSKGASDAVPKVARTDPEAYFSYLKGRGALVTRSVEGLSLAAGYFDEALAMSPAYRPAKIGAVYSEALLGLVHGEGLARRRALFEQALQLFDEAPADVWAGTAAAALGISLYEWHQVREVLELALGENNTDAGLVMLYADLSLSVNDGDAAAYELSRLRTFAPGLEPESYLDSVANYKPTIENLGELYVQAAESNAWHAYQLPPGTAALRRAVFEDCQQELEAGKRSTQDGSSCKSLGSFVVPLLLHYERAEESLVALVALVEQYDFDAKLAHFPELQVLWARPEANDARNVLRLPRDAFAAVVVP